MTLFGKKWEKTKMFAALSLWNAVTNAGLLGPKSESRPDL